MVAKIGHGENLYGALSYNQLKVDKENGQVLFTHKMIETPDGQYSVAQLNRSFEPYLVANRKTEKPVLHISLNPDPKDKVSDEQFIAIAQQYMKTMGYGDQPFVVFKHTDIERTHIHIVSVCVDEQGRKIPDKFEKRRSMAVCRELEKRYHLTPATGQSRSRDERLFQPVDYKAGDIKSQIASVVRHLPAHYRFRNFGGYNALLSQYNITAEEVKGELQGQPKAGLMYFALDEQGRKAGNPFKASLFGKGAGYEALAQHYRKSKESLEADPARSLLKNAVAAAMHRTTGEAAFKEQLLQQGIGTVIRRTGEGRVYGITFIDYNSKTVWNGSHLGKEYAAGVFNNWWQRGDKTGVSDEAAQKPHVKPVWEQGSQPARPPGLFDFLESHEPAFYGDPSGILEGLGGILPQVQGDDYEELAFEQEIKKKKKFKRGRSR
ncbi:relaxase [Chitinophaga caeni]|uniref:Relaxase n=1 Tax=Chitinophaga caeni TaxID=2029983 RepID=A0A291QYL2_9BACT|nr:conjugal transfer protein MobB [Chitinophaga caeni]ATL48962.1 relaxase [Chitinophaga caeni]